MILERDTATGADVHVMPDDDQHEADLSCWCAPKEDEKTKRYRAQGGRSARIWIHHRPN